MVLLTRITLQLFPHYLWVNLKAEKVGIAKVGVGLNKARVRVGVEEDCCGVILLLDQQYC